MECLFKSEHFLISLPIRTLSLSGLRAGLREGAAVSRGDLTVDLQLAVVVDKTKFPELIHEKVGADASARHQFRRQAGYGHVTRRK
jgi:hypothetical protein